MDIFEKFFYYGTRIVGVILGVALISTLFVEVNDVETWRTLLLVVFIIVNTWNISSEKDYKEHKKEEVSK